jgi:sigma-E factor negative regulatory protein RseB
MSGNTVSFCNLSTRGCAYLLIAGVVVAAGAAQAADTPAATDAVTWLKKMAAASRQQNYSGTIVYQHGSSVETSRVTHFVNNAGGEFEKLETLDGPAREIIRSNDQVICYLPNARTVLIEDRNRNARNFPALVPESLHGISENYKIKTEGVDRVAGYDCQWIMLEPRDTLRYGRRFCAELGSALPLRAQTLNERGDAVESFGFTQLTLGGTFTRERVKSKYAEKSRAQNWRVDRSAFSMAQPMPADTGWVLSKPLAGFKKMMEAKRSLGGRSGAVSQIVLSDGLAAVSIFIEPMPPSQSAAPPAQALSHQGAVNIYKRPHGNHVVTVLGEAPAATIMQIANSVELKQTTASQ